MEKRQPDTSRAVYVKRIDLGELPVDIRDELDGLEEVYAICDDAGTQLALVNGEELAFNVARHHDYTPYGVN